MQKLVLFIFIISLISLKVSAQEISQIKSWQQKHPTVIFVSNDTYHHMSPQERELLEDKEVIFFTREISMSDIYLFEKAPNEKAHQYIHDENEYVKQWRANHPNVKIIKNSDFQNAASALQVEYEECDYCLILTSEEVTISDIESFEQDKN